MRSHRSTVHCWRVTTMRSTTKQRGPNNWRVSHLCDLTHRIVLPTTKKNIVRDVSNGYWHQSSESHAAHAPAEWSCVRWHTPGLFTLKIWQIFGRMRSDLTTTRSLTCCARASHVLDMTRSKYSCGCCVGHILLLHMHPVQKLFYA